MSSSARKPTDSELAAKILEICNEFDANYYKDAYCFNNDKFNNLILNLECNNTKVADEIRDFKNIFTEYHKKICISMIEYFKIINNKNNYIHLIIKMVNTMNNYLFYIYQYITIINNYEKYCLSIISKSKNRSKKIKITPNVNISNFYTYIENNKDSKYIYTITNFNEYIKYLIYDFNSIIYDNLSNSDLNTLDVYKNSLINVKSISFDNERDINDYIIDYKNYIIYYKSNINDLNELSILYQPNYVTIPQYHGICWFIAMITGIAYSDNNRILLCEKIHNKDEIFRTNHFANLIQYIIVNITNQKKIYQYTDNTILSSTLIKNIDNSYCNLFENLKRLPINTLYKLLHNKYEDATVKDNLTIVIKKRIEDIITRTSELEQSIIINQKKLNKNNDIIDDPLIQFIYDNILGKKEITINKADNLTAIVYNIVSSEPKVYYELGLINKHNYILKQLYDFLKITNLYVRDINDNYYTLKTDVFPSDPQIIIIDKYIISGENIDDKYTINKEFNIDKKTPMEIKFKGNNYKLDYMIHLSNGKKSHAIVGIIYDGIQYIYDSKNIIYRKTCPGKNKYLIPCSLVKHNWVDDLFTSKCININNCGILHIEKEIPNSHIKTLNEKLCYNYDSDYMLVYVKIDEGIAGGNNNKYVSIHKKINFIYKNKKYTRNIYIKNNKKYILFNKKYILLSKIKLVSNSH